MNNYFFQPVCLPPLPQNFVDEALHGDRSDLIVTSTDRHIKNEQGLYRNARLQRWRLSQALGDWLQQQGVHGFQDVSVQTIEQGETLGPHTDSWQSCKLFYLLQSGGDNVETIWYRQHGHALVREKWLLVEDTADLEEAHRMVIPVGQWGFINVQIIHEVKNMTSPRQAVVASFADYLDISGLLATQSTPATTAHSNLAAMTILG